MIKMKEVRRPTLPVIDEYVSIETNKGDFCETQSFQNDENGNSLSDLTALKEKAVQLKLTTRRQSYVTWKNECIDHSGQNFKPRLNMAESNEEEMSEISNPTLFTQEKKDKINDAISWIRTELQAMRIQDQDIARQLLALRTEIHELKLKWSCEDHKEMIEDAQYDLQEMHELQEICDLPEEFIPANPFKHIGVTKMNLNSRRFSIL